MTRDEAEAQANSIAARRYRGAHELRDAIASALLAAVEAERSAVEALVLKELARPRDIDRSFNRLADAIAARKTQP